MVDIVVQRGAGSSPGDDVNDPLLTDLSAALSRGRAELDQGALADAPVLTIRLHAVRLGELIEVDDSALGTWRGKVTNVTHTVSVDDDGNLDYDTKLTLRKPR